MLGIAIASAVSACGSTGSAAVGHTPATVGPLTGGIGPDPDWIQRYVEEGVFLSDEPGPYTITFTVLDSKPFYSPHRLTSKPSPTTHLVDDDYLVITAMASDPLTLGQVSAMTRAIGSRLDPYTLREAYRERLSNTLGLPEIYEKNVDSSFQEQFDDEAHWIDLPHFGVGRGPWPVGSIFDPNRLLAMLDSYVSNTALHRDRIWIDGLKGTIEQVVVRLPTVSDAHTFAVIKKDRLGEPIHTAFDSWLQLCNGQPVSWKALMTSEAEVKTGTRRFSFPIFVSPSAEERRLLYINGVETDSAGIVRINPACLPRRIENIFKPNAKCECGEDLIGECWSLTLLDTQTVPWGTAHQPVFEFLMRLDETE
ncbi:MAG: hypothetical protein ACNA8P_12870 [Phycisphaerales bacterium]